MQVSSISTMDARAHGKLSLYSSTTLPNLDGQYGTFCEKKKNYSSLEMDSYGSPHLFFIRDVWGPVTVIVSSLWDQPETDPNVWATVSTGRRGMWQAAFMWMDSCIHVFRLSLVFFVVFFDTQWEQTHMFRVKTGSLILKRERFSVLIFFSLGSCSSMKVLILASFHSGHWIDLALPLMKWESTVLYISSTHLLHPSGSCWL